jgi:hypothetical protein
MRSLSVPRIESLDLRPPDKIREVRFQAALDSMWEWPEFPAKLGYFIRTGKRLRVGGEYIVHITADTSKFEAAMREITRAVTDGLPVMIHHGNTVREIGKLRLTRRQRLRYYFASWRLWR